MHQVLFQPAVVPPVVPSFRLVQSGSEAGSFLQQVPMNLSAEEIRAIVLEVLG